MRDFQLEFSPFSFVALHEGAVHKQVNEHSTAYVKGMIHNSDYEEYLDLSTRDEHLPFTITAVDSSGETVTVFQGVTTDVKFKKVGNVITMTVEAKSGSYLMDIHEHFRTFQDPAVMHSDILDLLGETYSDYNYILKTTVETQVEGGSPSSQSKGNSMSANRAAPNAPSMSRESADQLSNALLANMFEQLSAFKTADSGGRSSAPPEESIARLSSLLSGDMSNLQNPGLQAMPRANPEPQLLQADQAALRSVMDNSLQAMKSSNQLPVFSPADRSVLLSCMGQSTQLSHLTPSIRGEFISTMDNSIQTMDRSSFSPAIGTSALPATIGSPERRTDLQAIDRSAQNPAMAATSMFTMTSQIQDTPIDQFTVQYWETDWAFAKRLASRLNTFLVPADTKPGTRFYFGIPHLDGHVLDDSIDFEVVTDYKHADEKKRYGLEDAGVADALAYVVEHRDIYAVGDLVKFQNMELYVERIITSFSGQELVHTYYLRHKSGLRTPRRYNSRMIGASLDAQVLDVQKDEVQVQITNDENAAQTIVQWFPFATVYSSPDGTGWYCMPEPGDQVRVYMPDQEEAHAVVFNALHVASEARNDPDIKSMRNKYGKEIRFTPNTLVMTNNTGMEISIIDDEGIRIDSNKNIFIKADGNIDISSGAGLSMLAADSVIVQQGGTSLVVDDNVAFTGGKLRMQ